MNADSEDFKFAKLTDKAIELFYKVYNELGHGFLEKVYENALCIELKKADIPIIQQAPIKVLYRGDTVGDYIADFLIDGKVILEIKACKSIAPEHEAQLLNYLKATEIEVGLLLNFGLKPEIKRMVFSNNRKRSA